MTWPTPQDYNEAIQMPALSFADDELRRGQPELGVLGMPRPISGAFASVYRMHCPYRDWAVRCFLRNVHDQYERYQQISRYLSRHGTAYTVGFQYLPRGIAVRDTIFPLLKMQWVDGRGLDQYMNEYSANPQKMYLLAENFRRMMATLWGTGVAHGDLQHGNIIVVNDDLRLVDYDGMFVPDLRGQIANELGHPNYQHPMRGAQHFENYLDNFSAWTIYASMACLSVDRTLWQQLSGGDECLLFRAADFANPLNSYVFSVMEYHDSEYVRTMGRLIRSFLRYRPENVPRLDDHVSPLEDLPTLTDPAALAHKLKAPTHLQSRDAADGARQFAWPKREFYEEAVKQPSMCFRDRELKRSQYTFEFAYGKHGIVFHFKGQQRHIAVKCFFRDFPDREARYEEIQKTLAATSAKGYFVDIDYQREGIFARGRWFPILKMDWVAGTPLDAYVKAQIHKNDLACPDAMQYKFRTMLRALGAAGIAHGDLSHSNVLVTNSGLKLVDYDGMFVPSLAGLQSLEFGDTLYQHPARGLNHYGPYLDSFSSWVIDNALNFLITYPDSYLWNWDMILQYCRSDLLMYAPQITFTPRGEQRVKAWDVKPDVRRRAQLMHLLEQFPIEQVPPLVADFGTNVLKREAFMSQVNQVLRSYTGS
jgi:tRNA A-37 threonylcarbamoyl transferase component Bud32